MFDSVIARCPSCGEKVEFQSKAGKCALSVYSRQSVPKVIALDLDEATEYCICGEPVVLQYRGKDELVRMEVYASNN